MYGLKKVSERWNPDSHNSAIIVIFHVQKVSEKLVLHFLCDFDMHYFEQYMQSFTNVL